MAPPRPARAGGAPGATTRRTAADATSDPSARDQEEDEDEDDDDDDAPASDDETSSNYSSVSGDSLPPIRAYGHTFHGSGRIYIPNDEAEDERSRLQHELHKLCLDGRLHDARLPIEDQDTAEAGEGGEGGHDEDGDDDDHDDRAGRADESSSLATPRFHILDIGSGNGIWAVEAARRYPSADVLGIDLSSAMLPKDVPPNLTFEVADASEPWPPRLYDFIHMRNLVGGGVRDWERLLSDALAHLKPGGALEFSEIRPRFYDVDAAAADLPAGEVPAIGRSCQEYQQLFADMCASEGVDFDPVPRAAEWFMRAGLDGLRERVDWLPVKVWGNDPIMRKKGEILGRMIDIGLDNWTLMLFGRSGRDEDETRALLERVKEETRNPKLRSYFNLCGLPRPAWITDRADVLQDLYHGEETRHS